MADERIEAVLALRGGRATVGRDRIRLLEAVARTGSISAAAQAVGLSYKAAWDAINAVNNLLPRPAVAAQTGGRHGGGTVVTEDGQALIASFHLLEDRLARVAAALADSAAPPDPLTLLGTIGMKTSARNAFRCTVEDIRSGGVNCEVILRLTDDQTLAATITEASLRELDLAVGTPVVALVKAPFVMLATGAAPPAVSTRNRLAGTVSRREDGPVSSEVALDIGGGKTLVSVVTRDSADRLGLVPGTPTWGLFQASHVILAVD